MLKKIGTFNLASANVDVFINTEMCGANFLLAPDTKSLPRIIIGTDTSNDGILSAIIHEAFEMLAMRQYLLMTPCLTPGDDYTNRMFIMNHVQFTEICNCVASFVNQVGPAINKALKNAKRTTK